jgi:hypothetical protein
MAMSGKAAAVILGFVALVTSILVPGIDLLPRIGLFLVGGIMVLLGATGGRDT